MAAWKAVGKVGQMALMMVAFVADGTVVEKVLSTADKMVTTLVSLMVAETVL